MTWLETILAQDVTKLLAAALLLFAVVPVMRYARNGRTRQSLGSLFSGQPSEETLSPTASSFLDKRIEHKVNGALASPVLQITTAQADMRKDVERLDEEREAAGRDRARVHARLESLERGQQRIEEKVDRLIERRDRG